LQDDLVTAEASLLELADDEVLKLGANLQQIEGEEQDSALGGLEQNGGDFDGIEDIDAGRCPGWISCEPDRAAAGRDVPIARSRNDFRQRSALCHPAGAM
jgi:hypothetical protein